MAGRSGFGTQHSFPGPYRSQFIPAFPPNFITCRSFCYVRISHPCVNMWPFPSYDRLQLPFVTRPSLVHCLAVRRGIYSFGSFSFILINSEWSIFRSIALINHSLCFHLRRGATQVSRLAPVTPSSLLSVCVLTSAGRSVATFGDLFIFHAVKFLTGRAINPIIGIAKLECDPKYLICLVISRSSQVNRGRNP